MLRRDEARKSLSKNPFFRSLDKRVLGIYLDEAVVVTDDGSARLKQSPAQVRSPVPSVVFSPPYRIRTSQEALGYAENLACYETWQLLSSLPPNVGLRWIMAGRTGAADVCVGPYCFRLNCSSVHLESEERTLLVIQYGADLRTP